jgi:transcriptional regulator with XRE-family HTH domain
VSHFGDLVRKLRKEKGLTLEAVAKKIGSHKGYVSGIENDKVNPPSVKIIKKYAKLFGQDARTLARLAWVDKAPAILREDAERFLEWVQADENTASRSGGKSAPPASLPENPKAT